MSDAKTILITGATSGIGLATAKYLDETGYRIILVGRNEEKTRIISEELNNAHYVIANLENTESIDNLFEYCICRGIKLDGLVHSAGCAVNMPIRSLKWEHIERQINLHYYSFLELCKCFYSKRVSNEGASIVALSSLASSTKLKGSVAYSASKAALNTAVSIASKEFVKRSIRVNAILPAYVDTRMNYGLESFIDISEKQPIGLIPPREVAYFIEFLLSEKAKYITGALIPISAGMEF